MSLTEVVQGRLSAGLAQEVGPLFKLRQGTRKLSLRVPLGVSVFHCV